MIVRAATEADLDAIVALLADDILGQTRETPGDPAYLAAFRRMQGQPGNILLVAEEGGEIVGTLQLIVMHGLSHRGTTRAEIEAVRVATSRRGTGLGRKLIEAAIGRARAEGARIVQLTSNASRTEAHRFYESLGFRASHIGMKLEL